MFLSPTRSPVAPVSINISIYTYTTQKHFLVISSTIVIISGIRHPEDITKKNDFGVFYGSRCSGSASKPDCYSVVELEPESPDRVGSKVKGQIAPAKTEGIFRF